jgi:hypothetical protein
MFTSWTNVDSIDSILTAAGTVLGRQLADGRVAPQPPAVVLKARAVQQDAPLLLFQPRSFY